MSIFGKLFRARDKPRDALNGSAYSFFFGGTAAGMTVNERTAMQMSAVYACVRILSEAVAALPLHFYEYNAAGGKEKALTHPLYVLLHDEPNPEMTAFSFRETLMTHLLLWGNGYAQIIRNGRGEVVALYDKLSVSASFQCTSTWAGKFKAYSKKDYVAVKLYDIETHGYVERSMRLRGFKAVPAEHSERTKGTDGLWTVSFTLEEF